MPRPSRVRRIANWTGHVLWPALWRLLCALGALVVVFYATFVSFMLLVFAGLGDPARSGRYSYAMDMLAIIPAGLCAIFAFRLVYWRSPQASTTHVIIKLTIAAVTLGTGGLMVIEGSRSATADSSIVVFGTGLVLHGVYWAYSTWDQLARTRRYLWRQRGGLCPHCGYDLTGNVSGRCPECGGAPRRLRSPRRVCF